MRCVRTCLIYTQYIRFAVINLRIVLECLKKTNSPISHRKFWFHFWSVYLVLISRPGCLWTFALKLAFIKWMLPTCTTLLLDLLFCSYPSIMKHFTNHVFALPCIYRLYLSVQPFRFPAWQCLASDTISRTRTQLCCSEQTHPMLVFEAHVTVDCVYKPDRPNLCTFTTGYHFCG